MQGKQLGAFQIECKLAEGGMGHVYRGFSLSDNTPVAIKTLRQECIHRREDVARFIREAGIYKQLIHPNLIRFYNFGFDVDVGFYLVTELFVGRDLEQALAQQDGPFPTQQALDIALQICAGLDFAHQKGIVHRDLKPGNIFLVRHEEKEVAKVFDFGIAKMIGRHNNHQLTMMGSALGTPLYMAPEQIRSGEHPMSPAADIYALGIMIFEMLTGCPPFTGSDPMEILAAHIRTPPPPLRKFKRRFAHSQMERLLLDMMAKDPHERPHSIEYCKERLWKAYQETQREDVTQTRFEMPNFEELQKCVRAQNAQQDVQEEYPKAVLYLKQHGTEKEVGWLLLNETLRMGSDEKADVSIQERGVRLQHAEIFCSPEGWITIRSSQDSLLRVNGARVRSSVLQHNDWITIGEAELRLHCF